MRAAPGERAEPDRVEQREGRVDPVGAGHHQLRDAVQGEAGERAVVGDERVGGEAIRVRQVHPAPADLHAHLLAPEHAEAEAYVLSVRFGAAAAADVVHEGGDRRDDVPRRAVGPERREAVSATLPIASRSSSLSARSSGSCAATAIARSEARSTGAFFFATGALVFFFATGVFVFAFATVAFFCFATTFFALAPAFGFPAATFFLELAFFTRCQRRR